MNQTKYSEPGTTIAAISTPQAPGGIGIIRISGPQAQAIAGKVFSPLHKKKAWRRFQDIQLFMERFMMKPVKSTRRSH